MTAIAIQTLFSEANCFNSFGPLGEAQLLKLAYLVRILKAFVPMAATDPQSLLAYGRCFPSFSNASMGDMMELSLLDQISQNATSGGGAGSSCLFCGATDPVAAPSCPCALAYNTATGSFWYWDASTATWVVLIAA